MLSISLLEHCYLAMGTLERCHGERRRFHGHTHTGRKWKGTKEQTLSVVHTYIPLHSYRKSESHGTVTGGRPGSWNDLPH